MLFIGLIAIVLGIVYVYYNNDIYNDKYNEIEGMDGTLATEALQGIVSIYNKDKMSVNNMDAKIMTADSITSGNINSKGELSLSGLKIKLTGDICAGNICMTSDNFMRMLDKLNKNEYMYSSDPKDYFIFNDILSGLSLSQDKLDERTPYVKNGDPKGFNATTYSNTNLWNGRTMINIGTSGNVYPNGLLVNMPANTSTLWIRILNERWSTFEIYDTNKNLYGRFSSGQRKLNNISPDGGTHDDSWNIHIWMPIGLPISQNPKKYIIVNPSNSNSDGWISGIAFSANPWGHASASALSYHWKNNASDEVRDWRDTWNNDHHASFIPSKITNIKVPIVHTNKDKLVYIVEHNDARSSNQHTLLKVDGKPIERFMTTYDNPFSRHYNSKLYQRYMAAKIPTSMLDKSKNFITLTVDMSKQKNNDHTITFRELGTHDLY